MSVIMTLIIKLSKHKNTNSNNIDINKDNNQNSNNSKSTTLRQKELSDQLVNKIVRHL